jgi:hypothetical protein
LPDETAYLAEQEELRVQFNQSRGGWQGFAAVGRLADFPQARAVG